MLVKLRKRFQLIIMVMVGIVLAIMLIASVAINTVSQYIRIQSELERVVGAGDNVNLQPHIGGHGSRPHERVESSTLPLYVVAIPMDGNTDWHPEGETTSMDEELINTAVSRLFPQGVAYAEGAGPDGGYSTIVSSGIYFDLGVVFAVAESTTEPVAHVRIAFADSGTLITPFIVQLVVSIVVWFLAMVALYFISRHVSRLAVQPAEEAWNKQRQFVADASHELKTPLSIILANNNIVKAHPEKSTVEQQQWLESTEEEANRMSNLVSDLLLLAQIENAEEMAKKELALTQAEKKERVGEGDSEAVSEGIMTAVDLSALVERSLLQFDALFFERGMVTESTIESGLQIDGNQEYLRRIIDILLENAAAYGNRGGTTKIELFSQTNGTSSALLTVSNSGALIPPDKIDRIFERFYRVDDAHSRAVEGSGLGLSLAKAIVEKHGGTISVTSEPTGEESAAGDEESLSGESAASAASAAGGKESPKEAESVPSSEATKEVETKGLAQTTFTVTFPLVNC